MEKIAAPSNELRTVAYDEKLADRVRKALSGRKGFTEKKMFGGVAFMLHGKMCCGVLKDELVVRVGAERYVKALSQPYTRPMDFTGRPLKGFVFIDPGGYRTDKALAKWVKQAVNFAKSLPRK